MLLRACDKLLFSSHPTVILEVSNIILQFPSPERIKRVRILRKTYIFVTFNIKNQVIKALLRFGNISSESKLIVLMQLERIAIDFSSLLKDFYKNFFII
jgi:hypothetical protein